MRHFQVSYEWWHHASEQERHLTEYMPKKNGRIHTDHGYFKIGMADNATEYALGIQEWSNIRAEAFV